MTDFIKEILQETKGNYYFYVFPLAIIVLLILLKRRRISFVLPLILITIGIVNPLFYYVWNKLGLYAYWRILWIVPIIPVFATLGSAINERIDNRWFKIVTTLVFASVLALMGSFVYLGEGGCFVIPATNVSKVPQGVADVADYLLSLKEKPRIIAESSISTYIRQYTGDIDTLYGRDVSGYIFSASSDAREVSNELESLVEDITVSEDVSLNDLYNGRNMSAVADVMLNDGYDYLVLNEVSEKLLDQLDESGFELVQNISGYSIYAVNGNPTVIKKRNELGQVISETSVDEEGNPVVNDDGYSTILYEYDRNGNVSKVFYTDVNGKGVLDRNNRAGYEREYDLQDHIILERNIDQDGNPIVANNEYAEMRREYMGKYWTKTSYYDTSGNLLNNTFGYASTERQLNEKGNVLDQVYYGEDGNKIVTTYGYAEIKKQYDGNYVVKEAYYGANSGLLNNKYGYAYVVNSKNGNSETHKYYGENEKPVMTTFGYSIVTREFDENKNIISEKYYDTEDKPLYMLAGYCGYIQAFDEDNKLISRTYIDENDKPVLRTDGYSMARWIKKNDVYSLHLYDLDSNEIPLSGINLAKDIKDDWSEWITPKYNIVNSTGDFGYLNLGEKNTGDSFMCQIEIEFKNIEKTSGEEFRFWTQGAQDGKWITGNIWNRKLIYLSEPPEDGIYIFTTTEKVSEKMTDISTFYLGFRCDNWASGSFRVRNIKVEVGDEATEWTPGV